MFLAEGKEKTDSPDHLLKRRKYSWFRYLGYLRSSKDGSVLDI